MTNRLASFRLARAVTWMVESGGVAAINLDTGLAAHIGYPQAAVWDFFCRRSSGLVEKTAVVAGIPESEAERMIAEAAERWRDDGLIEEVAD
jgi:hypothetical protein